MNVKRNNFVRTVHLGVYGQASADIIRSVKDAVSNNGTPLDSKSLRPVSVDRAPDGEVVFNVYDDLRWHYSIEKTVFRQTGYAVKDDARIREWLAGIVKGLVKSRIKGPSAGYFREYTPYNKARIVAEPKWNRNNREQLAFSAAPGAPTVCSVAEAYALYDRLSGREVSDKYGKDIVESVIGRPYDPVRTELEQYKAEELHRIQTELSSALQELTNWHTAEWNRIDAEYERRKAKVRDEAAEKAATLIADITASIELARSSEAVASAAV